jgi:hypothetical protein
VIVPVALPSATSTAPPPKLSASSAEDRSRNELGAAAFAGTFDTTWGRLDLQVEGSQIVGQYTNPSPGRLRGNFDGERFVYEWSQDDGTSGRGYFELTGDNLRGAWGVGDALDNGGEWTGVRTKMIRHPLIR